MRVEDRAVCLGVLAEHSKSFALSARLLPAGAREQAAAVYAWCRMGDDAVDLARAGDETSAWARERDRLLRVYAGEPMDEPILRAFQEVVAERRIPRCYPEEMLEGFRMDAELCRYRTLEELLVYCYRVAGTVGLMMCHVMGVSDSRALRHAAHLGMAMQLTNICRDVREDWGRGRVYLPDETLGVRAADELWARRGGPLPRELAPSLRDAVRRLLDHAEGLYLSGNDGLRWLSWRCALAARTASLVYARIGRVVAARDHDVWEGRAVVSPASKLLLAARAVGAGLLEIPSRLRRSRRPGVPEVALRFSGDLVPRPYRP